MTDSAHARHDNRWIQITEFGPRNWVHGLINGFDGYKFSAMVFEIGSRFGIDNGRISKLEIRKGSEVVAYYDRSWDVSPATPELQEILKAIVSGFPA